MSFTVFPSHDSLSPPGRERLHALLPQHPGREAAAIRERYRLAFGTGAQQLPDRLLGVQRQHPEGPRGQGPRRPRRLAATPQQLAAHEQQRPGGLRHGEGHEAPQGELLGVDL